MADIKAELDSKIFKYISYNLIKALQTQYVVSTSKLLQWVEDTIMAPNPEYILSESIKLVRANLWQSKMLPAMDSVIYSMQYVITSLVRHPAVPKKDLLKYLKKYQKNKTFCIRIICQLTLDLELLNFKQSRNEVQQCFKDWNNMCNSERAKKSLETTNRRHHRNSNKLRMLNRK